MENSNVERPSRVLDKALFCYLLRQLGNVYVTMQGKSGGACSSSSAAPPHPTHSPPPPLVGSGVGPRMMRGATSKARKKLPSPKEMVAHYESKGMQPQEASLKVIEDLQNLLLRVVNTNKTNDINTQHILRLEYKLDSKPGYPQTLAISILSGAVFHALPHVPASLATIWNYVRSSTSSP